MHPVGSITLEEANTTPSQKKKKKAVIKSMVQSLQLMANHNQRTTGSPISSREPLFKLRRLNYLEVHQLLQADWSVCFSFYGPSAPDVQ